MFRILSVIILSFTFNLAVSQNYSCLQYGVKHYFTNSENYLKGIRIDSLVTIGGDQLFYPFHTSRGPWEFVLGGIDYGTPDHTGGSWLGKKVIKHLDGTFIFDTYWNDSVIIKTQADLGDNWIFYSDTTDIYYKATVTAKDTMTILGSLDSVKKILIESFNSSGALHSDSCDGFEIYLSKNNGFVRIFDLYMFPYHAPGMPWSRYDDYWLAFSRSPNNEDGYGFGPLPPGKTVCSFNLISFINPTDNQLRASEIGDVYERGFYFSSASSALYPYSYYLDSIMSKDVYSDSVKYWYSGLSGYYYTWNYYTVSDNGGWYLTTRNYLFDTTKMPEEVASGWCNYYMPNDASHCTVSPKYRTGWVHVSCGRAVVYKVGFGKIDEVIGGDAFNQTKLLYSKKTGIPCGSYYNLDVNEPIGSINKVVITPNPANNVITIAPTKYNEALSISNLAGQVIYTGLCSSTRTNIDVSAYPAGVYFIKVGTQPVNKIIKQ